MKTSIAPRQVDTNAGETQEFTIKANGKAFRALISTLYENKIQSIVREIWSNALDAHVEAGCADVPFSVTFPTMLNPVFIVRDYGVSLEHDQVMRLYTTVFESTKEDTNDATGKFGLGSKSPFAYTDTFSVIAVKGGSKRFYSAVIGKTGIPAIHFLGEQETEEFDGLEVSFPIKTRDINAFRRAAQRVSHGFSVKPDVIKTPGEDEFQGWPELAVIAEGGDWKLLRGNIDGYSTQAYAKMGPVLYPINANVIEDLSEPERALLRSTVLIEFEMGELEMTPSREALSYGSDEPTIPSIKSKLKRIVEEMVKTFQKQYDACDTYWDACVAFGEHVTGSAPAVVTTALRAQAHWNGERLVTEWKTYSGDHPTLDIDLITGSRKKNAAYRFSKTDNPVIQFSDDVVFFIEDAGVDQRAGAKIRWEVTNRVSMPSTIYWIKATDYSRWKKLKTDTRERCRKSVEAFYNKIDGAEIVLVSDIELPATARGGSGGARRKTTARVWDGKGFDMWKDIDYADGGYYVKLNRNEPVYPHTHAAPGRMWKILNELGVIPDDAQLYGAPKSLWKKFERDNWTNIYDVAEEAFKKSKPVASIAKRALIMEVRATTELRWLDENLKLKRLSDGPARDALMFYQKITSYTLPDVSAFINLANALNRRDVINDWSDFDRTEIDYHVEAVDTYYPLLDMLRGGYSSRDATEIDKITKYVQMCDQLADIDSQETKTAAAA